jgi:hypothetical protein
MIDNPNVTDAIPSDGVADDEKCIVKKITMAKTRPWFSFHLSTALIGVVVAGCFLGLNVIERRSVHIIPAYSEIYVNVAGVAENLTHLESRMHYLARGWPFDLSRRFPKTPNGGHIDQPCHTRSPCFVLLRRSLGYPSMLQNQIGISEGFFAYSADYLLRLDSACFPSISSANRFVLLEIPG